MSNMKICSELQKTGAASATVLKSKRWVMLMNEQPAPFHNKIPDRFPFREKKHSHRSDVVLSKWKTFLDAE